MFSIVLELFPLLLSLCFVFCEDAKTPSTIPAKSSKMEDVSMKATAFTGKHIAQFLNVIKEDLRKNNDDYVEPVRISNPYLSVTQQTPLQTERNTTKTDTTQDKYQYKTGNFTLVNNLTLNMRSKEFIHNIRRFGRVQPVQKTINKRTSSINKILIPYTNKDTASQRNQYTTSFKYPKYVNTEKVHKFKKYEAHKKGIKDIQIMKPIMRNNEGRLRFSSNKDKEVAETKVREETEIPTAIELDMAPGVGGRMHAKRLKNYLCHRHVMMPEGPKYDNDGKMYMPAFEKISGHHYLQTIEPKFLLPKCCNCCKKSVLGCE